MPHIVGAGWGGAGTTGIIVRGCMERLLGIIDGKKNTCIED
jgi:hypothetical protein